MIVNQDSRAAYVKVAALAFMRNASAIAELITSRRCHRFPDSDSLPARADVMVALLCRGTRLGGGQNSGAMSENPERILPSENFSRQI